MNKLDVQQALTRLESQALHWEGYHGRSTDAVTRDIRLVRRFVAAERQEILVLRRWVLLGASRIEEAFQGSDTSDSLVAEMRDAAKPKRKPK